MPYVYKSLDYYCFIRFSYVFFFGLLKAFIKTEEDTLSVNRDANGIIKNSLKMAGSRGRIGPGQVKGQCPCGGLKGATPPGQHPLGETEFSHFYS